MKLYNNNNELGWLSFQRFRVQGAVIIKKRAFYQSFDR